MKNKLARLVVCAATIQMDRNVNRLQTRHGQNTLGSPELEPFDAGDLVVVILESDYNVYLDMMAKLERFMETMGMARRDK